MKKLFGCGFLFSVILVSCTTKDVATPTSSSNSFYKDSDVEVENIVPVQTSSSSVTVSFSTGYLRNITRVELMSSDNISTFCTTNAIDITNSSNSTETFTFDNNTIKGSTMHYMLRFKNLSGAWSYTNYVNLQIEAGN